jgi:hypothetical protein
VERDDDETRRDEMRWVRRQPTGRADGAGKLRAGRLEMGGPGDVDTRQDSER